VGKVVIGMKPLVGIIMGSQSDWETLTESAEMLEGLGIPFEVRVVSAHRTPDLLFEYAESAADRGLEVIIAGAGGAAHLPGMCAAKTALPVLGVPVESRTLKGIDSLLSIVQMPTGVPVATFAIGKAGAANAALFAAALLALRYPLIGKALRLFRNEQTERVLLLGDPRSPSEKRSQAFQRRKPKGRGLEGTRGAKRRTSKPRKS
jgi:5-(carboxyamino)imidazole ribonucleotide mutase